MPSVQTLLAPITAHAAMGLKGMEESAKIWTSARRIHTIAVRMHYAQIMLGPLAVNAEVGMKAMDVNALT